VRRERIFGGGYCAYSDPQRYSCRRDGAATLAALIWLSE
jgi:hypothetical protein